MANPLTGDARDTDAQAKLYGETHLDPEGVNAGASDPAGMSDPQQPSLPHAGAYAAFLPHSMGGSGRCSIDGMETGCAFAESFRDSGAGEECLDGNCGKQQVTIIKRVNGKIVDTKTINVMPGDPGWNGHLDGTYRVGSTLGNVDISNSSTAANLLQVFDYWGDRSNDYFGKMSAAPQNPARVPLSGDNLNQYRNERDRLLKLLRDKNSDCAKFLRSQLGLSGSRIARTVSSQRPFDATASTLTMGAAGLQPRNGLVSDFAVNDFFQQAGASSGTAVNARASQGATLRDVYYTPAGIVASVILHESLHIFFGPNLNDPELATRLGATQAEFENEGSQVISRILGEHGCR